MGRKLLLGLALASVVFASPAFAGDPAKTYQVMARAVGFTEGASGSVSVGVVYDSAVADSVAAKDAIMALNGGSLQVGQVALKATPVEASALAGTSGLGAVYIAPGLSAHYGAVQAYANGKKIPTLGAEIDCVRGGKCVVGAEVDPAVQVYVNNGAATAAGVNFQSAFRMMIKEL